MGNAENRTFCRLNPEASEGKTELRELQPCAGGGSGLTSGELYIKSYDFTKSRSLRGIGTYSPARVPSGTGPPLREAAARPLARNHIFETVGLITRLSATDVCSFFARLCRGPGFSGCLMHGVLAFLGGQESKPRTRRECAIPSRPQDVRSEYRPLENSETVRVLLPLFRRTTCPSGTPKPRTVPTQQAARAEPLFRPGRVPSSADRSPSFPATALNRNRSPARTGPHKARCRDPRRNPRRNGWTKRRSPHE